MQLGRRAAFIGLAAVVAAGLVWFSHAGSTTKSVDSPDLGRLQATLVIDFGDAPNHRILVRKLNDLPPSITGWELFKSAGVSVQGTDQYPTGFVCRIADWPTAANQNCHDTPTYAQGHWAYFVTNKNLGDGWVLSGQGAAMHHPECGGYEGWLWISPKNPAIPAAPRIYPKITECPK